MGCSSLTGEPAAPDERIISVRKPHDKPCISGCPVRHNVQLSTQPAGGLMRQPSLSDVALFAAVVEAGGFRSAAQTKGLSASSLSDCVRRLESDLGVRLLNRTTRSVTPTAAGERLLERLRPALAEIAAA